jgi:phosphoadenosine phosphosulfate reductase
MSVDLADVAPLVARFTKQTPQQILAWALTRFADRLVIASSFSAEDIVVIDIASRISRRFRVITLDTGRLPEETYDVIARVRERYQIEIETYFPERAAVEQLVRIKGPLSFRNSIDDRKECCRIRKVEPLSRALATADAWITGLRRSQSVTRHDVQPLEIDAGNGGKTKINPLWSFSDDELWAYVKKYSVPVSVLHERGYPSIGCAPCTRAVQPGEDVRAGRWWWESPEHKECGLHAR